MDDFWDVRMPERFTCGYQTRTQLYDYVHPKQYHLVRFNAPDPEEEASRFAGLIARAGVFDILCQGIGTSGHLALNEPGATDFRDRELVRVVDLAEQSKRQLRDDPNFRDLGYIPAKGITMTIPALLAARHVFTMVPLALKREILTRLAAIPEPTTDLPATILRRSRGELYVDRNSCPAAWSER
jgi:glucosamine-6-phosphate deaminase